MAEPVEPSSSSDEEAKEEAGSDQDEDEGEGEEEDADGSSPVIEQVFEPELGRTQQVMNQFDQAVNNANFGNTTEEDKRDGTGRLLQPPTMPGMGTDLANRTSDLTLVPVPFPFNAQPNQSTQMTAALR